MKAILLKPGTKELTLAKDWPEPKIETPTQVKVKICQVGICGTDREEAAGGRADAPEGEKFLVIGHEMFGIVEEVGKGVKNFKKSDPVVITVRRGCNECEPCKKDRYDLCETGRYQERGIKQRHGYQCEYVVEDEKFLVHVPDSIKHIAVLTEPTTVVEKAIDEACLLQTSHLPVDPDPIKWLQNKHVLVAGLGPIGLLASMVLRLRGADVIGMDIVEPDTPRPKILEAMGGKYKKADELLKDSSASSDMIVEAAGIAKLDFDLIQLLGNNGVYVLTGVPGDDRPLNVNGSKIMRQMVLKNQVMVGSVNASNKHFQMAVDDLEKAEKTWGGVVEKIISDKHPYQDFEKVLTQHNPNEIKTIIEWSSF